MARQDDQGDQIMMIFTTEFFEVQSSVTLERVGRGVGEMGLERLALCQD
jgi:hypothetical protein